MRLTHRVEGTKRVSKEILPAHSDLVGTGCHVRSLLVELEFEPEHFLVCRQTRELALMSYGVEFL